MSKTGLGIVGLSTTSKYADSFVVQVYPDSSYDPSTMIIQKSVYAVWDGEAWNQEDILFLDGFTIGTTYYLQCAVRSPVSGTLGAWSQWSVVAGATVVPACTFGGSYTGTLSGVSYLLAAGNVPADIDRFEAWWSLDGSTPTSSTAALYHTAPTTSFTVFAPGIPGQSVRLFVRGVNTAHQPQAWVAVGGSIPVMATVDAAGHISSTAIVSGKSTILGDISDLANGSVGFNSIANAHFAQLANAGSNDTLFLGWSSTDQSQIKVSASTAYEYSGSETLKISTVPQSVLAPGPTDHGFYTTNPVSVSPGAKYYVQALVKTREDFDLPSGVTAYTQIGAQVTYKDGTTSFLYLPNLTPDTDWVSVSGQVTIPASTSGGSLPVSAQFYIHTNLTNTTGASITMPNGSCWSVYVDHVVFTKVLTLTDQEIAKTGSIPISYSQAMTYSVGDTTIQWSWTINIYRTDNNQTITTASGTNLVTGLTASTVYYFYPYYDEDAEEVDFVSGGMGSDGTAHLTPNITLTQAQARCDRVPLSQAPVVAATSAAVAPPPPTGAGELSFTLAPIGTTAESQIDTITINTASVITRVANSSYYATITSGVGSDAPASVLFDTDSSGKLSDYTISYAGSFASSSPTLTTSMFLQTGGGSGGGDGVCLHSSMLVQEEKKGTISCSDLRVGDKVLGPYGYTPVLSVSSAPYDLWIRIETNCGQNLLVTPSHGFTLTDLEYKRAAELSLNDMIPTIDGATHPTGLSIVRETGIAVRVSLDAGLVAREWDHVYYTGDTVACVANHNSSLDCNPPTLS